MELNKSLYNLEWDTNPTKTKGSCGTYLKAFYNNVYYKAPSIDVFKGITIGYETIYEVIAFRLCNYFGFECVEYTLDYTLINFANKVIPAYISKSYNFKKINEQKISLEDFILLNNIDRYNLIDIFNFLNKIGIIEQIKNMLFFDFIINNLDRHGANIELLKGADNKFRLAPIYDNNLSFFVTYGNDINEISKINIKSFNQRNNSFFSNNRIYDNIDILMSFGGITLNKLNKENYKIILTKDLWEYLPEVIWLKLFELIEWRYDYANSKILLMER